MKKLFDFEHPSFKEHSPKIKRFLRYAYHSGMGEEQFMKGYNINTSHHRSPCELRSIYKRLVERFGFFYEDLSFLEEYGMPEIPFESTEETYRDSGFKHFRVGTCKGLWKATPDAYEILSVVNFSPGNGHFKVAMEWFELSCKRDNKKLRLREVFNEELRKKSIAEFGYKPIEGTDDLIREF